MCKDRSARPGPRCFLRATIACRLLSVPTELLLDVVEAIDDVASLRRFALTCKLARLVAEPVLYRAVLVTTGSQASCLAQALRHQPRAELVRILDLRPVPHGSGDLAALTPVVGAMTQLRALSIESPFANSSRWRSSAARAMWEPLTQGYRALFRGAQVGAGLQNLTSLTIHWSGAPKGAATRFWLLTEFYPIFTLPALQSLTVSCAVLDDDLARYASPEQHLAALRQQRHSLQQFTWVDKCFASDTDVRRVSTIPGRGLSDFTELHTLTLDGASALLFSVLLSECAPPNLVRMRIIRHDGGALLDHPADSVSDASTHIPGIPPPLALHRHLPRLHHLDLVFFSLHHHYTAPLLAKPDRRDRVKRLREEYHAHGIRLAVFSANRGITIPPHLFGEAAPAYRAEPA
ncbi:hypothetical protein C8R45DRAFT_1192996 [Mycena sanguinolenta]|nr:hypothetical protein C8R45DRAFT_1192996 [Mycena sanguinolenta]